MVNIRYIPLTIILGLALSAAGCTTNPFQSPSGAPVEQPAQSPTVKQEQRIEPPPVREAPPAVITPAPAEGPPPYIREEARSLPEEKPVTEKTAPAVVALLEDADQYTAAGKRAQAVASLERALRIDPKNPLLWNRLARMRMLDGQWMQSIAMAKKSNLFAAGNRTLQTENWRIIARSAESLGDKSGAARAWDMVRQLGND